MTYTITTTMQPAQEIIVSDTEYLGLLRSGLIHSAEPGGVEPEPDQWAHIFSPTPVRFDGDVAFQGNVEFLGTSTSTVGWLNVTSARFGATGSGTTDDTQAIQDAIDALPAAGGVVYLPSGTYKLTNTLTVDSYTTIQGDGDHTTVLQQTATDKDGIHGVDTSRVTIRDLALTGPGSGTGNGVHLEITSNPCTTYVHMLNVTASDFGANGIDVENPIVSVLDRVIAQTNGAAGIYLHGQPAGAAGTSCALNGCYGNTNATTGIHLYNMVHCQLNACAADNNVGGYLLEGCYGVTVSGSGAEANTGTALKIDGGWCVGVTGLFVYDNQTTGVHVTGTARAVDIQRAVEVDPHVGAANFIKVDTGCNVALLSCNNQTANSLAAGTTNILTDSAGGAVFNAYTTLANGGECDGDLTCYAASKGLVLTDRVSGSQYRLKVTSGTLAVEAVA